MTSYVILSTAIVAQSSTPQSSPVIPAHPIRRDAPNPPMIKLQQLLKDRKWAAADQETRQLLKNMDKVPSSPGACARNSPGGSRQPCDRRLSPRADPDSMPALRGCWRRTGGGAMRFECSQPRTTHQPRGDSCVRAGSGEAAVIALVEGLLEQIEKLAARLEVLAGQASKTSRNSSKPSSGDGFGKRTKSFRHKSDRSVSWWWNFGEGN